MNDDKTNIPQEAEQAAMPMKLDVTARPIEPKGNLVGFANLKINDSFVIEDFKILQSDKGFLWVCRASRIKTALPATVIPQNLSQRNFGRN